MRRRDILFGLPFLTMGCSTIFSKKDWNIPTGHGYLSDDMYTAARNLKSVDGKKYDDKDYALRIELIPGVKYINGFWSWKDKDYPNIWVAGLCGRTANKNKYRIQLGCDPRTGQSVNRLASVHEGGHYWLMSHRKMFNHPPEYRHLFHNWNDVKSADIISIFSTEKEEVVDGFYIDGLE